jgi:head-tail adaptor
MARPIRLSWPLVLEERQRVADGAGGYTETWVEVGMLWGDMQSRGVSATEATAGAISRIRYRIIVRGAPEGSQMRPQIGQRFRNGGRAFAIDSVSESDPSGIHLECWAREEVLA